MTSASRLGRIVRPRGHFLRSAQLERDFRDPTALAGYVTTPIALDHLRRIAAGLRPESGNRAFTVFGSYGSGKSTFALLLAHWLRGDLKKLPQHLQKDLAYGHYGLAKPPRLHPLLVTGSREPLPEVIRRAILADLEAHPSRKGRRGQFAALLAQETLTGAECLQLVSLYRRRIADMAGAPGLLLVIDELGKTLEFAAQNPERSDVFLWQLLAEEAGKRSNSPLVVVGILHEGFSSYAHALGLSKEREWEKVSGRYTQLPLRHSLDQTVCILASALNVDRQRLPSGAAKILSSQMKTACAQGWYGANASVAQLAKEAPNLFPLDPFVLPALDRFLHQHAQNERSVFSFLFAEEPFGLMDHLGRTQQLYALDNLYDYILHNFDHVLSDRREASTWVMIKSLVSAAEAGSDTSDRVLRAVAVLNLLNSSDLLATEPVLVSAIASAKKADVKRCIRELQAKEGKRVLFNRGSGGGLCLWPHVSVDLHAAYDRASLAIGTLDDPAEYVRTHVGNQCLVARRHYINTGNLRYFRVRYLTLAELEKTSADCSTLGRADGLLLVPLLRSDNEREKALMLAMQFSDIPECVVAVPSRAVTSLSEPIREALIWEHILINTPELNNDPYARDTVSLRRDRESARLADAIRATVGLGRFFGQSKSSLIWRGAEVPDIRTSRQFTAFLSTVFDAVYDAAPRIRHELLNREHLSSAAAAARQLLIQGLLEHPNEPAFGMDLERRPPEMSMYLSVFEKGWLHRPKKGTEDHVLKLPRKDTDEKQLNISPVMRALHAWLKERSDKRLSVPQVFDFLRDRPHGIKGGLAPLLLALEYALHGSEIAFYEDGRFLSHLTPAAMQRLLRAPETFEVQYCNVRGIRADVFTQLARLDVVDIPKGTTDLLDVVKPLCSFAAKLPPYVVKTKRLSPTAIAVRDTLLEAREPVTLLFADLPRACGVSPIKPDTRTRSSVAPLVSGLKSSTNELHACYYELRKRLLNALAAHFSADEKRDWRNSVAQRADVLFTAITDPKLKAFCFRLADATLTDEEWAESMAAFIVSKPPHQWVDGDESRFEFDLGELVGRFLRSEAAVFGKGTRQDPKIMRICLTQANGEERVQLASRASVPRERLDELAHAIEKVVEKEGATGLVALTEVLWKRLKE